MLVAKSPKPEAEKLNAEELAAYVDKGVSFWDTAATLKLLPLVYKSVRVQDVRIEEYIVLVELQRLAATNPAKSLPISVLSKHLIDLGIADTSGGASGFISRLVRRKLLAREWLTVETMAQHFPLVNGWSLGVSTTEQGEKVLENVRCDLLRGNVGTRKLKPRTRQKRPQLKRA